MIVIPDLTIPVYFLAAVTLFFTIITGRYLLLSGIFYAIFYIWHPAKWQQRKISRRQYVPLQLRKEIGWSAVTAAIFAVAGVLTVILWQKGYTLVYTKISAYGWWYVPVSLLGAMLLQETYYYWLHRWMHRPAVFRIVHKVHHDSHTTSPFTAFSFHPLEGILQAIVMPVTLMVVPMHPYVILVQLTVMSFSSVINHLNIEVYPVNFHRHTIGRWMIGATHHALHHKQYKYNMGLYFTFWDKLKKTESPAYEQQFIAATGSNESGHPNGDDGQ